MKNKKALFVLSALALTASSFAGSITYEKMQNRFEKPKLMGYGRHTGLQAALERAKEEGHNVIFLNDSRYPLKIALISSKDSSKTLIGKMNRVLPSGIVTVPYHESGYRVFTIDEQVPSITVNAPQIKNADGVIFVIRRARVGFGLGYDYALIPQGTFENLSE